jgi:hypothetical protein
VDYKFGFRQFFKWVKGHCKAQKRKIEMAISKKYATYCDLDWWQEKRSQPEMDMCPQNRQDIKVLNN